MKKSVKRLKEYDKIEFDAEAIIEGMKRLKGARRKPRALLLKKKFLKNLKRSQNLVVYPIRF